jgi:hypothetical protein
MGESRKKLSVGDDRALFVLSQGRCYAPGCMVPAFQKVEGHYTAQLRLAHIYAHSPGGARYNPMMTQEERDSWTNLILLCDSHHGRVDTRANAAEYPAVLLLQWKEDREEGRIGDLPQLQGISDLDLQQLLLRQVENVLDSIDKLEGVSQTVIEELKGIVEHRFLGPKLDIDAMDEFSRAVRSLGGMAFSDHVFDLKTATDNLRKMELVDHERVSTSVTSVVSQGVRRGGRVS